MSEPDVLPAERDGARLLADDDSADLDRPGGPSDPDRPEPTDRFATSRAARVIDCAVAVTFFLVGTAWTLDPFRTQFTGGTFANYFEGQARAFLDGDLAIERGMLGIEAFIRDGNEYMYFGPLLGLARVPFIAVSDQLDGRLTLISLFVGAALLYVQAIKLLDRILELVHPHGVGSPAERWVRLVWRVATSIGTVVLTLLAIPWAYHEAHLWSAALFTTVLNLMLRFPDGTGRHQWLLGVALFAVVLNRPTTAYAALIGVALLVGVAAWRRNADRRSIATLAGWGALALGATVSVNWAKFRRPFGIPMEDQFFSQVDENRAEMLARYDNKYFQTEFIPTNVWAYFRPNGVDLSTRFPFVDVPQDLPWVWGDAFYDATYRTASVTATNPLLVILSLLGVASVVTLRREAVLWRLLPVVVAGIIAGGGVAGWGYIATRYLTDFLPGMLVLSAIAIAVGLRRLDARSEPVDPRLGRVTRVAIVALVAWSVAANVAIAFNYSYSLGDRTEHMTRLLEVQDAAAGLIGPSIESRTVALDTLPYERYGPTPPGTLAIVGDCDALYYSNGDTVDTWVVVEYGDAPWYRQYELTPAADVLPGDRIELVYLSEDPTFSPDAYWFALTLRVDAIRDDELEYTLTMTDPFGALAAEELDLPRSTSRLDVTFDRHRRQFFVERDGRNVLYGHFDMDPLYDAADPGIRFAEPGSVTGFDLAVITPETPWCDRLQR